MKAAVMKAFGRSLEVMEWPEAEPGTGEVMVEVSCEPVLPYMEEVISGKRNFCSNRLLFPALAR